ncbi:hypothetical protein TrRE_jg8047 [Triparma retinervis]|uniref:Uncharacterized protein n=1 Tax=Triparma retinervis TaxID=2557542 RepID=A0A9W7A1X2_9STRA|nr:hypothetical protein TrRE_jg8047 [Triparma retinervis]
MAQTGLSELYALKKYLNTAQSSTVMVNGFGFQERGGEEGEGEGGEEDFEEGHGSSRTPERRRSEPSDRGEDEERGGQEGRSQS